MTQLLKIFWKEDHNLAYFQKKTVEKMLQCEYWPLYRKYSSLKNLPSIYYLYKFDEYRENPN